MLFLRLVFRVGLISFSIFWWGLPKKGGLAELRLFGGGGGGEGVTSFFQGGPDTLEDIMIKDPKGTL